MLNLKPLVHAILEDYALPCSDDGAKIIAASVSIQQ